MDASSSSYKNVFKRRNPFVLSPSCLTEEDLETYIASEIEEMKKHFSQTLQRCQKYGSNYFNSKNCKDDSATHEDMAIDENKLVTESLKSLQEKLSDTEKNVSNEVNAVKRHIVLVEAQFQSFNKELEKQTRRVFKIKEKAVLKKKMKELENIYASLMQVLNKKLHLAEKRSRDDASLKVDSYTKIANEMFGSGVNNLRLKNNYFNSDVIPITATKINIVLEQMREVNGEIANLRNVKRETDKYLQNLKHALKASVSPYNLSNNEFRSDEKQMSIGTAEKIQSQIERQVYLYPVFFENNLFFSQKHKLH